MRMTAENIVDAINRLSKDKFYSYIKETTPTKIMIVDITRPEGPIRIKRFNPEEGQSPETAMITSISANMIWRIANAISENQPINFDRILGASYNTRSALEALIAYTPQFYYCFPGRIETIKSSTKISVLVNPSIMIHSATHLKIILQLAIATTKSVKPSKKNNTDKKR